MPSDNCERGLALVSVLWAVSLLSLIAASLVPMTTLSAAIGRNERMRVEAEIIAEGATALAILGLLDSRFEKRWRVDGLARTIEFSGTPVRLEIQDVFGLIDLNEADVSLLRGLFQGVGVHADEAGILAARILDWRTAGDLHSLDGASKRDYDTAGLSYAPRGRAFQSVDELKLVLGMTTDLYAKVAPALTVYSRQPGFDANLAPRQALLALTQSDARHVDQLIATRQSSPGSVTNQGLTLPAGRIDPSLSLNGHAFMIKATVSYRRLAMTKETVVRITNDPKRPYLVLFAQ